MSTHEENIRTQHIPIDERYFPTLTVADHGQRVVGCNEPSNRMVCTYTQCLVSLAASRGRVV